MPKNPKRHTADQLEAAAAALASVVAQLDIACRTLDEVSRIGLWQKSDDSSDNRNQRKGLREADWAVADAGRRLAALRAQIPDMDPALDTLAADLAALNAFVESLPDRVADTMGDNPALDADRNAAERRITDLRERVDQLAASFHEQALQPRLAT